MQIDDSLNQSEEDLKNAELYGDVSLQEDEQSVGESSEVFE